MKIYPLWGKNYNFLNLTNDTMVKIKDPISWKQLKTKHEWKGRCNNLCIFELARNSRAKPARVGLHGARTWLGRVAASHFVTTLVCTLNVEYPPFAQFFATVSYLGLIVASSENGFGVILQIHVFHNVVHRTSHFFHFIEWEEALDDKKSICLVLKANHLHVYKLAALTGWKKFE